ncbi:hypothetical protein [Vibrio vulnificus]|uniref:hypothetical protein n=1 Tax=Vibrio vulnificus TaxID=672 RepID=UPI001EEB4078|nr:hypothetical protein [Vibrio vulnificus]MCG6288876.1 hypothetical protein [Vibrio vulnificus]
MGESLLELSYQTEQRWEKPLPASSTGGEVIFYPLPSVVRCSAAATYKPPLTLTLNRPINQANGDDVTRLPVTITGTRQRWYHVDFPVIFVWHINDGANPTLANGDGVFLNEEGAANPNPVLSTTVR